MTKRQRAQMMFNAFYEAIANNWAYCMIRGNWR